MKKLIFSLVLSCLVSACGARDKIEDAVDVVNVDRKPINYSKVGVNAFGNDARFGTTSQQYREVRDTLGVRFVRVLVGWDNGAQSSPDATPNFGLYDEIFASMPAGVEVLAVLTHIPSWMENSANWSEGDPRKTFVDKWIRPFVSRYANSEHLRAIQVWNEPNASDNGENSVLDIQASPSNYVNMLRYAKSVINSLAPGIKVVNAATTSINQNFPSSLEYNEAMRDAGVLSLVDIFAIHYYGKQFERVVVDDGVADFLNGLGKEIWVTESGAQGVNNQLAYVEEAWPFLEEKVSSISRFYYYQFTESTAADTTYGLRNLSAESPVSDLYVKLRDR